MKDYDVAIIGGGLLGSAFAWGLAARGQRSIVFDEGDRTRPCILESKGAITLAAPACSRFSSSETNQARRISGRG